MIYVFASGIYRSNPSLSAMSVRCRAACSRTCFWYWSGTVAVNARQRTVHSEIPAEAVGSRVTSRRSPVVVTGLNAIVLYASRLDG
jgi:hypothetical protein